MNNNLMLSQNLNQSFDVEAVRASQEVQASIIVAQKFPRNMDLVRERLLSSCKSPILAEHAIYAYPRGNQKVEGPSIRLAEAAAYAMGNMKYGLKETKSENENETKVIAFCWDMERNVQVTREITIKHLRKSGGQIKTIDDPRDIYEHVMSQAQRRVRACILEVVPSDIIEEAITVCNKTMESDRQGQSNEQYLQEILKAFKELGVTKEMLESRMGHKFDATQNSEVIELKKIYRSLRDGYSSVEDWFAGHKSTSTHPSEKMGQLKKDLETKSEEKQESKK